MKQGSLIDFLEYAASKPELSRELAELARRHGFEFSRSAELDDGELDAIAGGGSAFGSIHSKFRKSAKAIIDNL